MGQSEKEKEKKKKEKRKKKKEKRVLSFSFIFFFFPFLDFYLRKAEKQKSRKATDSLIFLFFFSFFFFPSFLRQSTMWPAFVAMALTGILGAYLLQKKLLADPFQTLPKEIIIAQENKRYLGILPELSSRPNFYNTFLWLVRKNGSPAAVSMLGSPFLFFAHPEQTRRIFASPGCGNKGGAGYALLDSFLGRFNLVGLSYEHWKPLRRKLTSVFHLANMRNFFRHMVDCTREMMRKIEEHNEERSRAFEALKKEGKVFKEVTKRHPLETDGLAMLFALDVITRAMFSEDSGVQRNPEKGMVQQLIYCTEYFSKMNMNPFHHYTHPFGYWKYCSLVSSLHGRFRSMIQQRRRELESMQKNEVPKDLVTLMLETTDPETGEKMTDEEITHQCFSFYFAGHDTTAHTIAWALWEISRRHDVQEAIYNEICEGIQDPENPTFDEINKLSYISWVTKETLRLHPPVPSIGRKTDQDLDIGDTKIPKGTEFYIIVSAHHYNEELWEDPELFMPERFSPENSEGRDPAAWIPFSYGERNCIGMNFALLEIKLVLAMLCRKYLVRPALESLPYHEARLTSAIGDGSYVSFVPRHS